LIGLHVWATRRSLRKPRATQDALQRIVDPIQGRLLQPLVSRQRYQPQSITADPRPNGRPPRHDRYRQLAERGFDGWRFEIGGLVERQLSLSLDDLRPMKPERQVTLHKCIQGWSYIARGQVWTIIRFCQVVCRRSCCGASWSSTYGMIPPARK
jgi:DMSO/TMAO reductase YedYZ molybdopterin-dependent catalytic subunit